MRTYEEISQDLDIKLTELENIVKRHLGLDIIERVEKQLQKLKEAK